MARYNEIIKLFQMLCAAGIPCTMRTEHGGYHLFYCGKRDLVTVCSVIQHAFSFGGSRDLLEIRGLLTDEEARWDSVVGNLSAADVFERIKQHWEASK